jgi:hypothetical protein
VLGVLVVHAGNRIDGAEREEPRFPPERELAVAERLGELLDVLDPDGVVTSAAAGADLLMVEAAAKRGAPIHLVLPFPVARFRQASVEDQGPRWVASFDHAVESVASSLVELALQPGSEGLLVGNQALLDRAVALAAGHGLLVVAVRPLGGDVPPSVTDDFVRRARAMGLFVIEVDPRRDQ